MSNVKTDLLKKLLEVGGTKPTKKLYMGRFEAEFTLQAVSNKEMKRLREQATFVTKKGEDFNAEMFNSLVIVQGLVEPNLNDKSVIDAYGAPEDAIDVLFLPGEVQRLSAEISTLSGFGDSEENGEDEIKN